MYCRHKFNRASSSASTVYFVQLRSFEIVCRFHQTRNSDLLYQAADSNQSEHIVLPTHANLYMLSFQLYLTFFLMGITILQSELRPSFSTCEWRDLPFNADSERHDFLSNFFTAGLFTLRVFARNLLRGNRREEIFFFIFSMPDLGYEPRLYV